MIKIFDSHLGKKIDFKPIKKGRIGMYLCGPTVYDVAHLGHGRSAVSFDVIRRYFIYRGFEVKFVSNYTDIDDKMINRANEEGITVAELTKKIVPEYERDYGALGVLTANVQPYATGHIPEMIDLMKRLEERGFTYVLDDGVYFDVSKFKAYGKFSGQNLEELEMGARVEVKESKRNPYDFVLWKFKKEGEPFWESPWGDGRPGWHIECSAMSFKHLGGTFDIHGGGLDLKFPHHECEVAQSHAALGDGSFAQHWLHNGFIQVDNEKMSKSLGNFFTLKDVFQKYDPKVVRFMFMQTHYRNPINFSDVLLEQAKAGLMRLHDFVAKIMNLMIPENAKYGENHEISESIKKYELDCLNAFELAMDNDFDTSGALAALFDFVKNVNSYNDKDGLSYDDANGIYEFLKKLDEVFACIFTTLGKIDEDVEVLIKKRGEARENRDFEKADKIRDELLKKGIVLEDTPEGTIWKKI